MAEEHKHGTMNIEAQEKTFEGFVTFTVRTIVVILVMVVALAVINV